MCLTETWQRSMTDDCLYDASPAGYSFISQTRSRRRGGGVAIIYRSHIRVHKLFIQRTPQLEIVSMKIKYLRRRFILMCVYKSPRYNDIRSVKKIGSMLKGVRSLDLPVIITGDLNIHLDDLSESQTAWFNYYVTLKGMMQNVSCPTHVAGHCLDVVITASRNVEINDVCVEPPMYSDHSLIIWNCKVKQIQRQVCRMLRQRKTHRRLEMVV